MAFACVFWHLVWTKATYYRKLGAQQFSLLCKQLIVAGSLISAVGPICLNILEVVYEQRPQHVHVITIALQELIGFEHGIALTSTSVDDLVGTVAQSRRVGWRCLVCWGGDWTVNTWRCWQLWWAFCWLLWF